MVRRRVKMRKIKEILRLHFDCSLSNEKIGNSLRISKTSVFNCLDRFKNSGLKWPLSEEMTEENIEERLYSYSQESSETQLPDFGQVHSELSRPHMTLELLWEEYRKANSEGVSRSSFYRHYEVYAKTLKVEMKIIHKGGDKIFVDYSGDKLHYFSREQRKKVEVELFVASWGASSYCYIEASPSQKGQEWVMSHARAMSYFECCPNAIVPDNLKSGVTKACFYEPQINALYEKFAQHYNVAILPARVRKPKDKPVVESNILHLQRFIFGRLRNCTFFSLYDLNQALWEVLELFNSRPMQQYKSSRKERFNQLDKPNAKPLPESPFKYTQIKIDVSVAPNYHIEFDKHYYSVPYEYVRKKADVYQINNILEIYIKGKHVCRHQKEFPNYQYTTNCEHMPPHHKFIRGWSAPWFIGQGNKIGEATAQVIEKTIGNKKHPEQGFRAAMGILNLTKQFSKERVEKAAIRALHFNSCSYGSIKSILKQGLENEPPAEKKTRKPVHHENIRGDQHYR